MPRKAGNTISGTVNVKVRVDFDTSGAASYAALVSNGGSGYFANQALQAARKWTLTPPTINGRTVASEWSLRFEFTRDGTQAVPPRTSPSLYSHGVKWKAAERIDTKEILETLFWFRPRRVGIRSASASTAC